MVIVGLIGAILGIGMIVGLASIFIACYVMILMEGVKLVSRNAGHRWVTLGLLLVVLSVVAGLSWNSTECRVLLVAVLYLLPVVRLVCLAMSRLKRKWSTNEKWYFSLLLFVSGWFVIGPLWLVPRAVWQSLGPILHGS